MLCRFLAVVAFLVTGTMLLNSAEVPRFIVVAPEGFQPSVAEFVAFKQARFRTELHTLQSILASSEGADDPEKLKRFLYRDWKERGLRFVLLVGDVDVMPVRYMVLDRITPAAFDYSFYP